MQTAMLLTLALGTLSAAQQSGANADVPKYHRGMWLLDSLAVADLIVAGTPGRPDAKAPAKLEIVKAMLGEIHTDLRLGDGAIKLAAPGMTGAEVSRLLRLDF